MEHLLLHIYLFRFRAWLKGKQKRYILKMPLNWYLNCSTALEQNSAELENLKKSSVLSHQQFLHIYLGVIKNASARKFQPVFQEGPTCQGMGKDGVGPAELFPALNWAGQFVSACTGRDIVMDELIWACVAQLPQEGSEGTRSGAWGKLWFGIWMWI